MLLITDWLVSRNGFQSLDFRNPHKRVLDGSGLDIEIRLKVRYEAADASSILVASEESHNWLSVIDNVIGIEDLKLHYASLDGA